MKAFVNGKEVKVGDSVGFKSDVEQSGVITAITRDHFHRICLELEPGSLEGFDGDYISGQSSTTVFPEECWVE